MANTDMQTPLAMFPTPPHVLLEPNVTYFRPEEVELCYKAAYRGDLDEVKKQVHQLLHETRPLSEPQKPHPEWLYSSLSTAIEKQNIEIVRFLLDENVVGKDFPADVAVHARAFSVLDLFLQYEWDINQPRGRNETPSLSIPLATGDKEMVTWFLDHGADPNARCVWDFTPTSQAVFEATFSLITYIFSRGANAQRGQLLQHATHRNDPNALTIVQLLVERGAPINEVKYENEQSVYWEREPFGLGTPLHRAAELGKGDIVKYLLEQGADPLKLDSRGKRPRFCAEKRGFIDIARVLLEAELTPSTIRPCS